MLLTDYWVWSASTVASKLAVLVGRSGIPFCPVTLAAGCRVVGRCSSPPHLCLRVGLVWLTHACQQARWSWTMYARSRKHDPRHASICAVHQEKAIYKIYRPDWDWSAWTGLV
jgi:hypothetical protein